MDPTVADKIDSLVRIVEHGFAALAEDIGALKSDLGDVRAAMVTQTDHHAFRQETLDNFRSLHEEIADIRADLEDLERSIESYAGFAKEIDHALARIAAIERRLGIDKRIAA